MKSTVGRPRVVTDEQIARILEWHAELMAWKAQRKARKTARELARELGLSSATLYDVIHARGEFKQASPQDRGAECERRRQRLQHIHSPLRR